MRLMSTESASQNTGRRRTAVLLAVTLLLTLPMALAGSALPAPARGRTSVDAEELDVDDATALEQLTRVFGVGRVSDYYVQRRRNSDEAGETLQSSARRRVRHRTPPEYMVDLYNTIAYNDGISKTAAPYEADVVRGIPDRGRR